MSNNLINDSKLKDKLTKLSKEISIKKWDLGATIGKDISVQIDKSEPKQIKATQKSSITIRVWNKSNQVGVTSTSDLTENGLRKALSSAYEASNFANPNESPDFSPLSKRTLPIIEKPIKESLGVKDLLNNLIKAEQILLNKDYSIKSVPYNGFAESKYERAYINSDGAERHMEATQASLYLYARAEEEGRKPRCSGSIKIAHGASDIDIEACINEAAEKTIDHLNYKPIKTGKYLICFKPEAFLDLITSFSNIYNARAIIDGISLSKKDSLGESIATDILSINDDGLHPRNFSSCTFDGEGTPTQNLKIIEKGVLKNFIHSESTAKIFNVSPTGHAGIGAKVLVSPDWPVVYKESSQNARNPELSYKNTKEEFVLVENLNALHAGVKASQGSFSLPFDGWIVKNGTKTSIESATIAGDFRQLLKNIIQIESREHVTHHGISPHIWINELSITGDT